MLKQLAPYLIEPGAILLALVAFFATRKYGMLKRLAIGFAVFVLYVILFMAYFLWLAGDR